MMIELSSSRTKYISKISARQIYLIPSSLHYVFYKQELEKRGVACTSHELGGLDHFQITEDLQNEDYELTQVRESRDSHMTLM